MKTFERFDNTQFKFADVAKFIFLFVFFVGQSAYAQTFRYPVLGRLTEKNGKPVDGPVTLQVNFYRTETGGASLLSMPANNVPLQEGIFQLSLDLTPSDYNLVFSSVTDLVYVEITDVTHDPSAPYPRMLVGMTAYAGKVPVDSKTTYFNSSGQLAVGPNASPSAGQFLTKDGSGNFVWATPSGINSGDTSIGSIALGAQQTLGLGGLTTTQEGTLGAGLGAGDKGKTWFNTDLNQLKYWDGSSAVAVGASGAGLTNFNGQSGLTQSLATSTAAGTAPAWSSASNVHTLQIPMASAATVTAGLLSKTDYDSFVAKLDKTGGTMSGSINLGGNDLRNIANVILGTGDSTGTPVAGTFMGPSGLGTDISGTDLTFDASKGTGSSGSGGFAFRVAPSGGASGATANTLATAMKLSNQGFLGIGTTSPTSSIDVTGAITQRGIAAPAVSASAQGRIYFDSTTNKFMVSEHAGAYQPLVGAGTVTSVSGSGPISVATGTTTPAISITQADSTHDGYVSSTDWNTFNNKISSTRTITAGTGLSGGGDLSADRTLSLGVATNTTLGGMKATTGKITLDGAGAITNIAADTAASVTGTVAIANGGTGQITAGAALTALLPTQTSNSGKVLTTDGTSASWTTATGVQSLNGLTGATQTFGINTASGTAPAWGSATTVHTLTIPMASATSVTAGLLSKTDYDSFVAKLDKAGGTMSGSINIGGNDLTNTANIVLGTGNATATPVGGTLSAPNATGTDISGSNLTFDASKGTGSSGSGGFIFRTTASGGASGTTANTLAASMKLTNAGYLGIGTTSPSAVLHLKAGTATASTAPLKLTSGTVLTTPEAGAIEYDGTSLYYTDSTATRQMISTSSGATTYTGAITMSAAGTGLAVTNNATIGGTLAVTGVATLSGGAAVGANQNFAMASGTGTFNQTYTGTTTSASTIIADSVTTAPAQQISADGLTSGSIMSLSSTSTAAAAGNTGLDIGISGANATSSITRYGMKSSVTATGTTSTNVGGYFTASGATNNYGLIVDSGNVGIGTTAPITKLEIIDNTNGSLITRIYNSNSGSGAYAGLQTRSDTAVANLMTFSSTYGGNLANTTMLYSGGAWPIALGTNSAERFRIDSNGNIGIGTTSPLYQLHMAKTTGDNVLYVSAGTPTTTAGDSYLMLASSRADTGVGHVVKIQSVAPSVGKADMAFLTQPSSGVFTERMRIDNAGNVGIGYTNPLDKLVVAADADGNAVFTGRSPGGVGNNNRFKLLAYSHGGGSGYGGGLKIQTTTPANAFADRLTIDSSGNIGIGTTSPTAVLHLKAGTSTANTAPLKLTSGPVLTTAEAGALEYDGTSLFYTNDSAQRLTIATTAGALSSLAVTSNATVGGTLGVTGATTFSGGATVAANQNFAMSSGTGTFTQTYTGITTGAQTITANSVTTASVESVSANGLTSGNILNLTSTSTAAAAGNTGLNIGISGANGTSSITRYGMQSAVTATGTSSTNVAGYFSASGATNNYGLIVANGNVGIGTTSPAAKLHVDGDGELLRIGDSALTDKYITFRDTLQGVMFGLDADLGGLLGAALIQAGTNKGFGVTVGTSTFGTGTPSFYIDKLGAVGIGTTSPDYLLDVTASTTGGTVIQVKNPTAGTGNYADLRVGTDAGTLDIVTTSSTWTTNGWNVQAGTSIGANGLGGLSIGASNSVGILRFYTGGSADTNERMRVDASGNVGIGTTSPSAMVHVLSSDSATAALEGGSGNSRLNFRNTATGSVGTDGSFLGITSTGNTQLWNYENAFIQIATNDTERVRIDPAGNVGIGTTTPGQKLDVAGSITAAMNSVTFSATPTFNAALGNTQKITLTGNVTSSTLSNATAGQMLYFIICQDATGSRTFAWPANVKNGMTIGTTLSKCNAQNFIFDGTNAYALGPGSTNM